MVVLNFNGSSSIGPCLESINSQSSLPHEILLVDNDSSDGSADYAERRFPGLRVIRNLRNLGFSEGNNVGIRNSSGDLVLFANNDVILNRDALSSLTTALGSHVAIASGIILDGSGSKIWSYGGRFDPLTGMHWHPLQGQSANSPVPTDAVNWDYAPGAFFLVRRSFLDKVNLLDPYYFLYGDDIDLSLKAKRLGYSVKVIPVPVASHLVSQSVKKMEQEHELLGYYMMNRNMFYLYFSQLPVPLAVTSTLSQLAFLWFEILLFRRPLSYVKAKMKALGGAIQDGGKARKARARAEEMGRLPIKLNPRALVSLVHARSTSRVYYW